MKIGICARTWAEKGGIGGYTRNMVSNLLMLDSDNEYVIFYVDPSLTGQFRKHANVKEVFVPLRTKPFGSKLATLIWDQYSSLRMAKKFQMDVILHPKMSVPYFTRIKTVMLVHGTERYLYPDFQHFFNEIFLKIVNRRFMKKADLIITDAENGKRDIVQYEGIDASKIKVVHLAGDAAFHVIKDAERLEKIKASHCLPDRFVIFVGHIYPGKNIGRLLSAFAEVRKRIDIDLVLVGGMRRKFESDLAEISRLGLSNHVHVTGFVPIEDLVGLYNLAEATVFPSIYECFPAIPLDAGSCGCPVITSDTGGTPESAGDAAEYVDPFDERDIARGIIKVLEDTAWREELIRRGFLNSARFSWQKTAEGTRQALGSLDTAS